MYASTVEMKGFNMFRLFSSFFAVVMASFLMAGCAQTQLTQERLAAMTLEERTAALLQQPQVDDIYAANLVKFSEYTFGSGGDAFGLLRVIHVTADSIVVVTEDAAWPSPQGAHDDLNGNFSDITWDFDEEITIRRADLSSFQQNGSILEARRLTSEQIRSYLVN